MFNFIKRLFGKLLPAPTPAPVPPKKVKKVAVTKKPGVSSPKAAKPTVAAVEKPVKAVSKPRTPKPKETVEPITETAPKTRKTRKKVETVSAEVVSIVNEPPVKKPRTKAKK
jgi:hypothetical protein